MSRNESRVTWNEKAIFMRECQWLKRACDQLVTSVVWLQDCMQAENRRTDLPMATFIRLQSAVLPPLKLSDIKVRLNIGTIL